MIHRIGDTRKVWATKFSRGWTVFHVQQGLVDVNLTKLEAQRLVDDLLGIFELTLEAPPS